MVSHLRTNIIVFYENRFRDMIQTGLKRVGLNLVKVGVFPSLIELFKVVHLYVKGLDINLKLL